MTEEDKKVSKDEFKLALRRLLATRQRLSRAEMADMFSEDGGLGSQMRNVLMDGSQPPPPEFLSALDEVSTEPGAAVGGHPALERHRRRWNLYRRGGGR